MASWQTNAWVKKGILLGFRIGALVESGDPQVLRFVDKDTYPDPPISRRKTGCGWCPGGSSVRAGAYVAPSVVCMPPMYINVGAYVDEGSMVDSHALVGSCAQVGKRVHISAAAQIGGVLEPINASPVIMEDDVLVGGNCGVYEGTQVGERSGVGSGSDPDALDAAVRSGERYIHRSSEIAVLYACLREQLSCRVRAQSPRARPASGDCRCTLR